MLELLEAKSTTAVDLESLECTSAVVRLRNTFLFFLKNTLINTFLRNALLRNTLLRNILVRNTLFRSILLRNTLLKKCTLEK